MFISEWNRNKKYTSFKSNPKSLSHTLLCMWL